MTAWMCRFKIGVRIYAGFGIVLLALAVLSVNAYRCLNYISVRQNEFVEFSFNTFQVQQIERNLVGLRRNMYAYLVTGSLQEFKRAEELVSTIKTQFAELDKTLHDQSLSGKVADLRLSVENYFAAARKSVEVREGRDWIMSTGFVPSVEASAINLDRTQQAAMAAGKFEFAANLGQAQRMLWSFRYYAESYDATAKTENIAQARADLATLHQIVAKAQADANDDDLRARMEKIKKRTDEIDNGFIKSIEYIESYHVLANKTLPGLAEIFRGLSSTLTKTMSESLTSLDHEIDGQISETIRNTVILSGIIFVSGTLLAWLIGGGITGPLVHMTGTMTKLAAGELGIAVPGLDNGDEIGGMARAVQVFKENAQENERLKAEQQREAEAKHHRQEEAEELIDMFGSSVSGVFDSLSKASVTMASTAQSMGAAAIETNAQVDIVTHAIAQTSENAQSVASASQELTAAIGEIGRLINSSTQVAQEGAEQAKVVAAKVVTLHEASERIGSIISIIANIASQTNLLALNATIEAARAGEAGKGFAVVASEVKSLSQQTQKATVDISSQIGEIQNSIAGTVDSVQAIGHTINDIHNSTSEIAAAITEQQSATDEIARNVQFVSSSAEEIAQSIVKVRDSADETSSASAKVRDASDSMAGQADKLSAEVKDFLSAIKGAGTRHEFHRLSIDVSATVKVGGHSDTARAQQLSIGGAWLNTRIDQPLGSQVDLTLDGVSRPIRARIAGVAENSTRLQFPMDTDHLAFMGEVLDQLSRRRTG